MEIIVDTDTPVNSKLCAKYKRSFAYPTVIDRLPVIVTSIIDFLVRDKNGLSDDTKVELKACIGELSELKYILQTAKPLTYFTSKQPDTEKWNNGIKRCEEDVDELTFYSGPWLFVECYLYRRISEIFVMSETLKDYDPFNDKKVRVLQNSLPLIQPLFEHLINEKILESLPLRTTDLINEFVKLIKHSLWANRVDLSITSGNTEAFQSLNIEEWEDNILVNDIEKVLNCLFSPSSPTKGEKIIDYVLDNTGLELLSDLCMADFLVAKCKIDRIRFRVKRIPWFVSDCTIADFNFTLDQCAKDNSTASQFFAARWKDYLSKDVWTLHNDDYWTLGLSYDEMPESDPTLYSQLQKANLIIFKGDLNYRKLVQDTNWEPTTAFSLALGRFRPSSLVAIRTLKADTIAGLQPGQAQATSSKSPDWLLSGQYGLIQYDSTQD